jgi:multiple sugar transport system substrate-binding protein
MQGKEIETDVYFYYALWSYGGDIMKEDGTSGLDSPEAVQAATMYKGLIDAGLTEPGVTSLNREDVQNLFKQGKVGMMITAPFLVNQIKEERPTSNTAWRPSRRSGRRARHLRRDRLHHHVPELENKDEAWKFLDFLFQPEQRITFTKNEGFLPVTQAEAQDPALRQRSGPEGFHRPSA